MVLKYCQWLPKPIMVEKAERQQQCAVWDNNFMGSAKSALYVNPVAGRYEQPVSLSSAPANRRGRENQTKRKTLANNQNKNVEQHLFPPQLEKRTFSVTFVVLIYGQWVPFLGGGPQKMEISHDFCY